MLHHSHSGTLAMRGIYVCVHACIVRVSYVCKYMRICVCVYVGMRCVCMGV